jgi:hypothetical protein
MARSPEGISTGADFWKIWSRADFHRHFFQPHLDQKIDTR